MFNTSYTELCSLTHNFELLTLSKKQATVFLTTEELHRASKKIMDLKSPGPDGFPATSKIPTHKYSYDESTAETQQRFNPSLTHFYQ